MRKGFSAALLAAACLGGCATLLSIDEDYGLGDPGSGGGGASATNTTASSGGAGGQTTSSTTASGGNSSSGGGATCPADPVPGVGGGGGGTSCPAACTSCNGTVCTIACNGNQACKSNTINCPAGYECQVECGGNQSCQDTTIRCADDAPCHVACLLGNQACTGEFRLICGENSPCSIACDGEKCESAAVTCGNHRCEANCNGNIKPNLNCADSCECTPC